MYKTILVPIDLGEASFADLVVKEALKVLEPHGQLILLTVVPGYQMPLVGSFFPQGAFDNVVKHTRAQLQAFISSNLPIDPHECTMVVEEGKPAESIIGVSERMGVELIVMASHKQSRVERHVIGSIASKVVGRSDIPVLVVKG